MRLQPLVRARVADLGEAGQAWAEALPVVLTDLARRWSLRLGRRLPGGSASYLTTALRADGTEVVVKVALPGPGFVARAAALTTAGGRGYVCVLDVDECHEALLLERLGPSLEHARTDVEERLDALSATLLTAWHPSGAPAYDKAGALAEGIAAAHAQHPGSASDAVVARALACAAELAWPGLVEPVQVHGDPHPGNLLRVRRPRPGADSGWCFVDPEPFVGEPAYDLGVAVRDFSAKLLAEPATAADRLRGWCARVAAPSGTDPERVWAWAYLERVSTGLSVTSFGAPRVGTPFLRSAALLL